MKKEKVFVHVIANCVIAFAVLAVALGGAYTVGALPVSAAKNRGIRQGNVAERRITLMVNVYWGEEYLPDMLDIFQKEGVRTTFFVGGSWVAKHPDLLKRMVADGHEIGNHGYLHKGCKNLSLTANREEILLCHRLVKEYTGVEMNLFAPPSGELGDNMFTVCEQENYKVILWSRDTIDWRDKDRDTVLKRVVSDPQNGDFVLMHPTAHSLAALPEMIQKLKEKNFEITTVSQNLL